MPNKTSNKGLENGIDYQAPLQDMAFLLNEVFPLQSQKRLIKILKKNYSY